MPIDPGGNHSLPPGTIVQTGDKILPSQHNPAMEDISATLSKTLIRDGRAPMTGPLRMGGYPIRNVQAGEGSNDAATVGQTVPIGTILDYALPTPPAGWIFCYGQALTSGQYPLLRQALLDAGSPYGTDGSGNPRVPDYRGRVGAGRDNMGGTSADRLTNKPGGVNGDVLGATGGAETHALIVAQLARHLHGSGTLKALHGGRHSHLLATRVGGSAGQPNSVARDAEFSLTTSSTAVQQGGEHEHNVGGNTSETGAGEAHNNVQPTLIVNKIIRAGY